MPLIRLGSDTPETNFRRFRKKRESLYVPRPSMMGADSDSQGDFTKGIGQGLGIVLGVVGAGWVASKIMNRSGG